MTKVHIVLMGLGGELAREVIDPDINDDLAITEAVVKLLQGGEWLLSVGDTLHIEEVE